ncbi:hypothetical protein [Formosa algae]|uniref:hypothetical protein n=1 Tax=Formosa algae TaxID=225843 RepID=UPI0011AF3A8D|nr:hypothetical protein [Formosa algae]
MKQTLILLSTFLVLFNCKEKQTDLEFEQSVAYEIFPALMAKLHFDIRLAPPPPPQPIYDTKNNLIGYDTIMAEKTIAEWKKRKRNLKLILPNW